MLGNRLGWCIAAVLAALLIWTGFQLADINRLTPPTPLAAEAARATLAFEIPPEQVMKFDEPGDSGALYRDAFKSLRDEPTGYAAVEQSTQADAFEKTPAGVALLAAARKPAGPILSTDPLACGDYDPMTDSLDAATQAARLLGRAALLHRSRDRLTSRRLFEAQFALGAKLFAERVRYAEAAAGLAIVREAVAGLLTVLGPEDDVRRGATLATFDRSAAGLQESQLAPVWNALGAIDGHVIAAHTGDALALAGPDTRERLWRIEAILALGRHRYATARQADRLAIPTHIATLAESETDPIILTALHAAASLTIERYRMLQ